MEKNTLDSAPPAEKVQSESLSAAQRARLERNRERARALRASRAAARAAPADPGGGFLPEPEAEPRAAAPRPAPLADPAERPACLECGRPVASSHLLDTFDFPVCDECRDDGGAHALVTRTEAKAEYLLPDRELDALRCVVRRNPHASRGDMRLYVRAAVEARALAAWGSAERLEEELAARARRRAEARARRGARALRVLRMSVRSSLFAGARAPHEHAWGPETYDADSDTYSRACDCGHTQTYEKL